MSNIFRIVHTTNYENWFIFWVSYTKIMEQWHFFLRHRVVLVKQFWSITGNLGLCGLTINTLIYITLNKKKTESSCPITSYTQTYLCNHSLSSWYEEMLLITVTRAHAAWFRLGSNSIWRQKFLGGMFHNVPPGPKFWGGMSLHAS